MLELESVSYKHADHLLFEFSFNIENSSSLAIIGPSASGKSTLLNLIAGFLYPTKGKIIFNEQDITKIPPHKRPVNMLFQEKNLFPHLSVFNNVAVGINPNLNLDKEETKIVKNALDRVGLLGCASRIPQQLSGGQKQRVAIARTIVRKKPILLLDEPFSFLDPPLRLEMLDLMYELQKENNFTMLMVTHDYNDCLRISDKICFLSSGKILHINNTKDFVKTTNSSIIKKFLGLR